ncbi:DUF5682 family protein [Stappia indica]|uniref:DUF5682 family protein n=1 Tax=Stappia indica TaxID=538381 RepID=UPI001495AD3A|nr:DUF5682 family protein [Stappia indica]
MGGVLRGGMNDASEIERARDGIFQPARGLWFAPIRHHSPVCSRALRAMIREIRPDRILVEGPADFDPLIPLLVQSETRPPVAIVSLASRDAETGVAGYFPFCAHSPEYIALREGNAIGADTRFIDLPSSLRLGARGDPARALPLAEDRSFSAGDYVTALADRLGCRDGHDLWDHLFETRLGESDWRGLFPDVAAYSAVLRAGMAPDEEGTLREAAMSNHIAAALEQGDRVLVVVGGAHVPALLEPRTRALPSPRTVARSYLVRYSFAALDALGGYAAGLPAPGYYDRIWQSFETADDNGQLAWEAAHHGLLSDFTRRMRDEGHQAPLPALVEASRLAKGLAAMRGRPTPQRQDVIEGIVTAFVKDDGPDRELWTSRLRSFLCGDGLGEVPANAGTPPLVEDARQRARKLRIDIDDGANRRRALDVHRKPSHLAASRYFHAMCLLETRFARLEAGFNHGTSGRHSRLHEIWNHAWSARVEARLIELAPLGDNLPAVCARHLDHAYKMLGETGRRDDLGAKVDLLRQAILAGLEAGVASLSLRLEADLAAAADFSTLAAALQRLAYLDATRGPLAAPAAARLPELLATAYRRLVYLCDDLPRLSENAGRDAIRAIRIVCELLRGPGGSMLDARLFDAALARVALRPVAPGLLGAVLGACVQSGRCPAEDLVTALEGHFGGVALKHGQRSAVLSGMLHVAPGLLQWSPAILDCVDGLVASLDEREFIDLLPELRLAFTALAPREIDLLAEALSERHRTRIQPHSPSFSRDDLGRAAALGRELRRVLERDGLVGWLSTEGTP